MTLFEREEIGAFSQASSINSGFLHAEPTIDPTGTEDWNSFSSRLSMYVYKYLDASDKVEYKDTGMMLAIQGSRPTCSSFHFVELKFDD